MKNNNRPVGTHSCPDCQGTGQRRSISIQKRQVSFSRNSCQTCEGKGWVGRPDTAVLANKKNFCLDCKIPLEDEAIETHARSGHHLALMVGDGDYQDLEIPGGII